MKQITYNRDSKDFDMYLDGRYIGSAATHAEAERRLDAEAFERAKRQQSDAENAARQTAEDAASAAYNAEHAAYEIAYNADNGDYDVIYGKGEPWEVWLGSAPTYADGDAVIDAHIARMQAQERRQAEWSEQVHHGAYVIKRAGPPWLVGVVVRLREIWIEVEWPNGELARYREDELEVVNGDACAARIADLEQSIQALQRRIMARRG